MHIRESIAYLADLQQSMVIVYVSDPTNPTEISQHAETIEGDRNESIGSFKRNINSEFISIFSAGAFTAIINTDFNKVTQITDIKDLEPPIPTSNISKLTIDVNLKRR
ncbi:MAG: hypothetical protein U9O98_00170 [Asgard group archaeon]|nr:hypothetical protein [Asgard group archaeon]